VAALQKSQSSQELVEIATTLAQQSPLLQQQVTTIVTSYQQALLNTQHQQQQQLTHQLQQQLIQVQLAGFGMFVGKLVWEFSQSETFTIGSSQFVIKDTILSLIPQLEVAYNLVLKKYMLEIKNQRPGRIKAAAQEVIKNINTADTIT